MDQQEMNEYPVPHYKLNAFANLLDRCKIEIKYLDTTKTTLSQIAIYSGKISVINIH